MFDQHSPVLQFDLSFISSVHSDAFILLFFQAYLSEQHMHLFWSEILAL